MKFLIVDDNAPMRELLRAILSPYAHCDLAFDGDEAVEAFRRGLEEGEPYDFVCLDVMMPNLDGFQALDAIRQLEEQNGRCASQGAKVLVMAATPAPEHNARVFRPGCESYCTKPITPKKLLRHVRELLGQLSELPASSGETSPA
ncbi:MAG: response regulator [Pirellulales bacterium]|nr:response regulator [Pirellulales bacterium]